MVTQNNQVFSEIKLMVEQANTIMLAAHKGWWWCSWIPAGLRLSLIAAGKQVIMVLPDGVPSVIAFLMVTSRLRPTDTRQIYLSLWLCYRPAGPAIRNPHGRYQHRPAYQWSICKSKPGTARSTRTMIIAIMHDWAILHKQFLMLYWQALLLTRLDFKYQTWALKRFVPESCSRKAEINWATKRFAHQVLRQSNLGARIM